MRGKRIARAGETGRLRQQGLGRVGRIVVTLEKAYSAALPRHAHARGEIVRGSARNASGVYASVTVSVEDPAFVVGCDFIEIKKVAVLMSSAILPDTAGVLNGIVRRGVNDGPVLTAIVGRGNERVPLARKAVCLVIAIDVCPEESDGSAS